MNRPRYIVRLQLLALDPEGPPQPLCMVSKTYDAEPPAQALFLAVMAHIPLEDEAA